MHNIKAGRFGRESEAPGLFIAKLAGGTHIPEYSPEKVYNNLSIR